MLDRGMAACPEREALVGRHGRFSYVTLDAAAAQAAGALAALGVRPGDRVAASLPNDAAIVVAFLGAMRLGAVWVGVNRPLAPPEKAYMLRYAGVSVLLGDPAAAAELDSRRSELPELRHVVTVDPEGPADEWHALLDGAPDPPAVDIDPFAPAAIAYTSGTTGFPKGAVHSQHNLVLVGWSALRRGAVAPGERLGVALPLTILNLMVLGPVLTAQALMTAVAMDRIDAVGMAGWIRDERINTFSAVPAMIHDLLTNPGVADADLVSLHRPGVGGADLPEAFRRLYRERFGVEVGTGYGLTEAPTTVTQEDLSKPLLPGSAGQPLPQVEIVVLDDEGDEVPPGQVGEVCVRPASSGPMAGLYTPMLGYWNRPDDTREALRGGVLHTRDVGLIGEGGNLFIKDRKADLIIRGGANVYPAEVERVLHTDSRVAACAVLGRPDERLGERVVAFVEPVIGAVVTADEVRALCAAELARYKVPEEIVFVDGFERTPMGKIRKTALRDTLR